LESRDYAQYNTGTAQPKLNKFVCSEIPVLCPPPPEQRAIAGALSDVDALLGALDQLIAKKRDLKQAAMQQLLTGHKRLPGFHGEWEVKWLGDVVEIRKGELITEKDAIPGNIPVIAGGKKPSYFHNRANRTGKTITISGSGASAGYVSFFETPIFASDCSTISEGTSYAIQFIYFVLHLRQEEISRAQTGGAQPHIHPNDLRPMSIRVPQVAEQTAIAEMLSDMDADLAALTQRRDKTRALKQGMMQELLTGRTRLV
jgi:type I restriction enzyme S subunit